MMRLGPGKLTVGLLVASVIAAGCGGRSETTPGSGEETFGPQELTPAEREAFVYSAVIKHMTSEEGQSSGFQVIYVLDQAVEGAADPDANGDAGTPISQEVQIRVQEELALLPPIRFIPDRDEVIGPPEDGSQVENGGILIILGPVPAGDDRVEVEASSYLGNLAATFQTWVLERRGLRWEVTGTTGPVATA
jgi:hypothetical protein